MTILFFSATGNCLFVAKSCGGTLKSIPQLVRNGEYEISDDVIGIVSPVYFLNLPRLVKDYLSLVKLNADYVFGILTYGLKCGGVAYQLKKVLESNGNTLHYAAELLMVDNYLPGFKMEDEIKIKSDRQINTDLDEILKNIENHYKGMPQKGIMWRMLSIIFNKIMMESKMGKSRLDHTDKKFTITDKCTQCGICTKVCPVANIYLEELPEFQNHCESCFACIHNCPTNAIRVAGQKSEYQFRNKGVSIGELIQYNSIKIK